MYALDEVGAAIDRGALEGNRDALDELIMLWATPPYSMLRAMYAALTDRYYGLSSLGLASIRERAGISDELLEKLPNIAGIAETPEAKLALTRAWLGQWPTSRHGIWFQSMTEGEWWKVRGGVKAHKGNFKSMNLWLGKPGVKVFEEQWLPVLRNRLCEPIASKWRLAAGKVALQLDGEWGYCDRCRFTQRPFPGRNKCISCRADTVRVVDPDMDPVFSARKGYYRASTVRALANPPEPPMSIIAAEHTAQLNAAKSDAVFSRAEEYELLFQDVDISLPDANERQRAAIDVLSCTTTMEVGIDIGTLSGVALRNMPPSRANYQQRAGRAGRRGNAVATVIAFGSSDTHDNHYFEEPHEMIRGKVKDPILTMDNDEIARRHVTAYLLQRYHQDRLPEIDPEDQPQLFEVLGSVDDFVGTTSALNRADLEEWLKENEASLGVDIDDWLPSELLEHRAAVLDGIVTCTLADIDRALDLSGGDRP